MCDNDVVVVGYNDMATTHPHLAQEYLGDGFAITAGTNAMLDWRCMRCGHEWSATGVNRATRLSGCPSCAGPGYNPAQPGYFYLVTDTEIVKGGVTNVLARRLRQHAKQGLSIVKASYLFEDGRDALALERLWIEYIARDPQLQVSRERLPDGYTEALVVHEGLDEVLATLQELATMQPSVAQLHERPTDLPD